MAALALRVINRMMNRCKCRRKLEQPNGTAYLLYHIQYNPTRERQGGDIHRFGHNVEHLLADTSPRRPPLY
jgi:uncharacterized membrane protein